MQAVKNQPDDNSVYPYSVQHSTAYNQTSTVGSNDNSKSLLWVLLKTINAKYTFYDV